MLVLQIRIQDVLSSYFTDVLPFSRPPEEHTPSKKGSEKRVQNSLANLAATHSRTYIAKLIALATSSDCPDELKALIAGMANDALSHAKEQALDKEAAHKFASLIALAPGNIKGLLFAALVDAKTIEEEANHNEPELNQPFETNANCLTWKNPRNAKFLTAA